MSAVFRVTGTVLTALLLCLPGFVVPGRADAQQSTERSKNGRVRQLVAEQPVGANRRHSKRSPSPLVTQTVSNSTPISIPSEGAATPYPSNISIAGLPGSVTDVTVTINNFSHTFPDNVGIVLVGPTGTALMLQDGAGDDPNMINVTYTLTDFALAKLPDSAAWGPGEYQPTQYHSADSFPAPGPGLFYNNPGPVDKGAATLASVFGGTDANGTWSLYVCDFATGDSGSISGGWTLQITTDALPAGPGDLIISEFRLRGPNGANDEFIEIYNNTDAGHTVIASDGSSGYAVVSASNTALNDNNPTIRFIIPNGTIIPAHGHYLGVNSVGYSLAAYPAGNGTTATGNITYTTDIADNDGMALFNAANVISLTLPNRLDAVGSNAVTNTLYKEGTGYTALPLLSTDHSFYRDECGKGGLVTTFGPCPSGGAVVDTNNNVADFLFVDTNGTSGAIDGQNLGAPGPQNLSSPIRSSLIFTSLIDPCFAASSPPNRVRDFTSDPGNNSTFGTLDIRRTFTNNTGGDITRLRFRVIDITTFPAPSSFADLRPRTSPDITAMVSLDPCGSGTGVITVSGTTLEEPPSQLNGGGYNSSLSPGVAQAGKGASRITLPTPLPDGGSITVRFLLGIQQTGKFKIFINVEALP
ncbi:MAG: hypothetical protein ACREBG_09990 [Pyrinomonadaceae bacterium]